MLRGGLPSIPIALRSILLSFMCFASVRFQIENTIVPTMASTKQEPETHLRYPTHDAFLLGGFRSSVLLVTPYLFKFLTWSFRAISLRRNELTVTKMAKPNATQDAYRRYSPTALARGTMSLRNTSEMPKP